MRVRVCVCGRGNASLAKVWTRCGHTLSFSGVSVGPPCGVGSTVWNQHTREFISARKTSHKHSNKDLSYLR